MSPINGLLTVVRTVVTFLNRNCISHPAELMQTNKILNIISCCEMVPCIGFVDEIADRCTLAVLFSLLIMDFRFRVEESTIAS